MRRSTKTKLAAGLLIPVVAAVTAYAFTGTANAIANGEPVPDGKYSFSVKLTMTGIPTATGGKRNSACSGALIAPQWVITAGHCFRDADGVRVERPVADLTTATVGRTDLTGTGGREVKVVAVRQSTTADVSLAKLDTPIRTVRPIRLSNRAPEIGAVVRLTGYGSTQSANPVPETRLRTGQMSVVSLADSVTGLTGHAPEPDTTPCPYDSGGPFFLEGKRGPALVAVVSNGPSCPHGSVENAARVDNITPWIYKAMRDGRK
ncbi:S1 family peptidase [Actinoplanes friuliensis]|uniref:Thrombin-like enzyme gussurobin n=1 Tax=Actinoplanes friuliensis DSM 7358 TaxID=1246995 RepID=U5W0Y6_9ACTN|nr:trypsin-like serine protease [Actinoplanes friuliensis]AGZ41615.1 Thrombin-like enzyme gussurobin [Actinoplanes friuliensis DSM 7358]